MNDKLTKAVTENGQYERIVSMRKTWKRRLGSRKLLPITVKVPVLQVNLMEFLVNEGFFPSKSEFVRSAVEEKLDNYLLTIERMAAVKKKFDIEVKTQ